jgi:tetratricopeptide (TPR) repeat protein
MSFTFVTAYFEFDSSKNDFYFNHFKNLAEMKFSIILYLDTKLESRKNELSKYDNVKIISMSWSDLPINRHLIENGVSVLEKPKSLTESKDTSDFLILMNSKPYFLLKSKDLTDKETLVWVDFGILKITSDLEHFKSNFSKLKKYNQILIPGGFQPKKQLSEDELMNNIYWRFLGGVIVCPKELVEQFCVDHTVELNKLLQKNKITWECNIWANIEMNTKYMRYYRADHNKTMFGFSDKKVILISMIKNEEKIIRRCIDSVLNICDAFCVSDTMSTDNTVQIVKDMIEEFRMKNIPGKLYQNPWKDFGHNRSISYNNTCEFCDELGWDSEFTYGLLLDADMKLVVLPTFNKQELTHNAYKIIQDNGCIEYHNTRFVRLNKTWKCVGVTHEYWDGPDLGTINRDQIYIHDIGDGGAKADKFERDMRLLIKGIEDEPNNGRYHFYLAQTCKDLGKYKEAIKLYKKRIEIGGWDEEVWFSHYMIARCWLALGNVGKAELWANKAYENRRSRAEPVYMMCNLFRDRSQHFKAYHYYKIGKSIPMSGDSLFVETSIYKHKFDYENTILHYWLFPTDRLGGLRSTIDYLNKTNENEQNVYNNLDFYIQKMANEGTIINMDCPLVDNYTASSPSIVELNGKTIVNLRYVNYRIQPDGSYMMHDNGTFNHANNVKTRNGVVYMDKDYNMITSPMFLDHNLTDIPKLDSGIRGLEDIRLMTFKDKIYYTATTREYSYIKETNRIVFGEYDINNMKFINNKSLKPPTETNCEKNWITVNHKNEKILFIYNWHPLQIGELDEHNKLNITIKYDTPLFWRHYRGSSSVVEYNNQLWCITHGVKYSTPRKYFHQFVVLEKDTYKPIKYSVPFFFNEYKIEYCVGLLCKNDEMVMMFSQNDKDPNILRLPISKIDKYMMNV